MIQKKIHSTHFWEAGFSFLYFKKRIWFCFKEELVHLDDFIEDKVLFSGICAKICNNITYSLILQKFKEQYYLLHPAADEEFYHNIIPIHTKQKWKIKYKEWEGKRLADGKLQINVVKINKWVQDIFNKLR